VQDIVSGIHRDEVGPPTPDRQLTRRATYGRTGRAKKQVGTALEGNLPLISGPRISSAAHRTVCPLSWILLANSYVFCLVRSVPTAFRPFVLLIRRLWVRVPRAPQTALDQPSRPVANDPKSRTALRERIRPRLTEAVRRSAGQSSCCQSVAIRRTKRDCSAETGSQFYATHSNNVC
jgi:hypothetical protein